MTLDEFNTQLTRLANQFGKTAYSTERARVLWRAVEHLSGDWMAHTVDGFLLNCRQAPLGEEFYREISRERERAWSHRKQEPELPKSETVYRCQLCRDNGTYVCTKWEESGIWAFRCHCSKGYADPRKQIPQFKQGHADLGFVYFDIVLARRTANA